MVASIQPVAPHDVALSVRDLTVTLPQGMERTHAVENISFDLKRGQILCIIGESGSGKSVTANAIMGLLPKVIRVSSGAIHLDGMNLVGMSPEKLRSLRGRVVSMIFQDPLSALNPLMTVGAQIDEVMAAHGVGTPKSRRDRAIDLADRGGSARSAAHVSSVSVPAFGRAAAAGDDRHGPGAGACDPDRGRANDGSRRHHPGPDPEADPRHSASQGNERDVHHP